MITDTALAILDAKDDQIWPMEVQGAPWFRCYVKFEVP